MAFPRENKDSNDRCCLPVSNVVAVLKYESANTLHLYDMQMPRGITFNLTVDIKSRGT